MRKTKPQQLKADWSRIPPRALWEHVTSRELSKVFGVHLQTINNWRIRDILPEPDEKSGRRRGNKNYYRVATIRAWLESRTEYDLIHEYVTDELDMCAEERKCINPRAVRFSLTRYYGVHPAYASKLAPDFDIA